MNVLIAGEFSGVIREAFRKRGHNAWSVDLIEAKDNSLYHIQADLYHCLDTYQQVSRRWNFRWDKSLIDLMIAHPPCDRILSAGALHFPEWIANGEQQKGIAFFLFLANQPIKRIAIENPVGIMSTIFRKPDQYIQPYEYGHMEIKRTCIWRKNLPALIPTNNVYEAMMKLPRNEREKVHYESPGIKDGLTRSQRRAVTYLGWAEAMAEQWGSIVL